jgi:hypothetical protein
MHAVRSGARAHVRFVRLFWRRAQHGSRNVCAGPEPTALLRVVSNVRAKPLRTATEAHTSGFSASIEAGSPRSVDPPEVRLKLRAPLRELV